MVAVASPIEYPHLRETPTTTLADLSERVSQNITSHRVENGESIRISEDRSTIQVNDIETPMNEMALATLATWVDFPKQFLDRLDTDLQRDWMNEMLRRKRDTGVVRIGQQSGITAVLKPNQVPFEVGHIVDVAARVLGDGGAVVDYNMSPTEFYLDATVPLNIGGRNPQNLGDPQVGDITKAGLRFAQNVAQNLAPTVQPYSYRLWCTNGASSVHEGLKIDARGQTVEEVIAELEAKARLAFGLVEADVTAMYDLRNQIVENPEREINRIAREQRLPDRSRLRLIDSLPGLVQDPGRVTMFEIINAATHMANDPSVRTRGGRVALENFAGAVITDHATRCAACRSKLN